MQPLEGEITCVDMNDKHIASGDKADKLSVWSLEAVLKGGQQPVDPLYQIDTKIEASSLWKKLFPSFLGQVRLGSNFVVSYKNGNDSVDVLELA